ncbi:hypothetical protein ACWEQ7_13835, partial [Streptomyces sp. NPDC004069]
QLAPHPGHRIRKKGRPAYGRTAHDKIFSSLLAGALGERVVIGDTGGARRGRGADPSVSLV